MFKSYLCQSTCHLWVGHSPVACWSSWLSCCHHHWGSHQLIRKAWKLHWRNKSLGFKDLHGGSGTTALGLSAPPESASWLPCGLWPGLSIWSRSREQLWEELREEAQWSFPCTLDFQDVSHNPSNWDSLWDLVPMTRLISTWLPISNGDQSKGSHQFYSWVRHPLGCASWPWEVQKNGSLPPPRTIIAWQGAVGGISPTKNLPTGTTVWSISLQGSSAPSSGLKAVALGLTISRTGKHSGSTLAASMGLVWRCPTDVRIWRLSSLNIGLAGDYDRGQPLHL